MCTFHPRNFTGWGSEGVKMIVTISGAKARTKKGIRISNFTFFSFVCKSIIDTRQVDCMAEEDVKMIQLRFGTWSIIDTRQVDCMAEEDVKMIQLRFGTRSIIDTR